MRNPTKRALALVAATSLLAVGLAGNAHARSLSFSERNFEFIWNNALTGKTKLRFAERSAERIECNVTLLGRYPSNTIAKRTEINQGTINHGETEGCNGGSATIRTETMPWNLRYRSFTGTLPAITSISTGIIGATFRFQESGTLTLRCVFMTEVNEPLVIITEGANLENVRVDETRSIILEGVLCEFGSPAHFSGRGLIQNLPRNANITVTLI